MTRREDIKNKTGFAVLDRSNDYAFSSNEHDLFFDAKLENVIQYKSDLMSLHYLGGRKEKLWKEETLLRV